MTTILLFGNRDRTALLARGLEIGISQFATGGSELIGIEVHEIELPLRFNRSNEVFEDLAERFAVWSNASRTIALVAEVNPMRLNPLLSGFEGLLAMLILAFPEVRWLFGTICGYSNNNDINEHLNEFRNKHGLHHLFCREPSPLFDGAGLREWIRDRIRADSNTRRDGAHVPTREKLAVGLDEESDYAYLHAYTAYRFGFLSAALTTKAHADCVLKTASKYNNPYLVFEDLFLNLPDAPGRGYSWLGKPNEKIAGHADYCPRHVDFPRLEQAEFRVLVTSGYRPAADKWKEIATKSYIQQKSTEGKRIVTLHKPHAGIFHIWSKTSLNRLLKWKDADGRSHVGTGKGFVWPPGWKEIERRNPLESGGHSAPGILLVVVNHMIDRADRLLEQAQTVEEALRGAVIASDALELLGGKTPTMAIAALTLKHQFEVRAVLQFAGVEYHFPVKNRLIEIRREIEAISRWFNKKQRVNAALNAEMGIVNELVREFRNHNQFTEEQICMNRVRYLEHTLWMKTTGWGYIFFPVLRYVEFLLSSFPKFCAALLFWVLALSFAFSVARHPIADNININLGTHPWGMTLSTFFGAEPLTQESLLWIFLTSIAVLAGLTHLGIFISHLYSLVSRK